MQISYKFWYITREDDSYISEAAIRFYEGENMDVEVADILGAKSTVNRYVRTKRLEPKDIPELMGVYRQEADGSYARSYTPSHFGKIKTDNELRLFINKEMAKHKGRTPQKDQAETKDIANVK